MSWKSINTIIGRAAIDPDFCRDLLVHPLNTAQKYGFELTLEERELLATITAHSLYEFSKIIVDRLTPDQ